MICQKAGGKILILCEVPYPKKVVRRLIRLFTHAVNKHMNKLKLLDLFSGIGGFSLGFEKTGAFETIAFCEKDKFCQSVLAKHWNNIRIYDEIRNLKGKEINADVVTGGFPCQPFSVAGKRKGTDDDRYLWDEMLRVITEVKARWIVGENVAGIINIENGKVLQQIQKDLESEGFQVQCLIIPASGVGAWHQRKRIFVIGCNVSNSKSLRPGRRSSEECGIEERKFQQTEQKRSSLRSEAEGCSSQNVSNSSSIGLSSKTNVKELERRRFSFEDNKTGGRSRLSTTESWWQIESKLRGIPDGICTGLDKNRANRIKALGNSIVPEIAYEIAKAILAAENERSH